MTKRDSASHSSQRLASKTSGMQERVIVTPVLVPIIIHWVVERDLPESLSY
jgi:hypothetical protein